MAELPARKRPLRAVRRLDHDAVDVRLDASLLDYGRISQEAGLTSEEAVNRLRGLLDHQTDRSTRSGLRFLQVAPRTVGLVLAVFVVIGALIWAGPMVIERTGRNDGLGQPNPIGIEAAPTGMGGFAEMFVAVYLGQAGEGAEEVLAPFVTEPVDLLGLLPGRLYVQNVAAIGAEQNATGWSVVVAAQVLRKIDGGYGDTVIQYYGVDVLVGDGFQSTGLPTQIAQP